MNLSWKQYDRFVNNSFYLYYIFMIFCFVNLIGNHVCA
jgi:hypothetical protein